MAAALIVVVGELAIVLVGVVGVVLFLVVRAFVVRAVALDELGDARGVVALVVLTHPRLFLVAGGELVLVIVADGGPILAVRRLIPFVVVAGVGLVLAVRRLVPFAAVAVRGVVLREALVVSLEGNARGLCYRRVRPVVGFVDDKL